MLLTIVLLSHNDDVNLISVIKDFKKEKPNCKLLIVDSKRERKDINELIKPNKDISIIYKQNKGIYDSMNIAISKISTDYYFIQGLDDRIIYKNFKSFLKFLDHNRVDLLFAGVIKGKKKLLYLYTQRRNILLGPSTYPSHTGGIAINKELHKKYGQYSQKLKVISDTFFISSCLLGNCSFAIHKKYISNIGSYGYSKRFENLAEYEAMIVRNKLGCNKYISSIIYIFRLSRRKLKKYILRVFNLYKNL